MHRQGRHRLGSVRARPLHAERGDGPDQAGRLRAGPSSLEKNQSAAYLDKVVFNYVAEDSVRTGNLTSGAIDIDWPRNPFTPQDEQLIQKSGDTVEKRSLPGVSYTQFANTGAGHPLSDAQVRQALYKAIDLKTYAATVFGPDYPVVQGAYDSTTPNFKSEAGKLAYDPTGAEKILEADGWVVGTGGYRFKGGKELTLDYPVTQFSDGAELLQAQLKTGRHQPEQYVPLAAWLPVSCCCCSYCSCRNRADA